ncbi:MAG: hypothetical protein K9J06_10485 [Flavobacteriales bacterium]|nr:hypothetical protein [Flavobacteriales bacterium]
MSSALLIAFAASTMVGCNNCENEDPRARIVNNGTDKASVQIWTTGGNTENINNIETGQTSDWRSFAPGLTNFTVSIQGANDTVLVVSMLSCMQYDIRISANNTVTAWSEDLQ